MSDPTPPAVSDARLTEREWRLREELREHWFAFCDADAVPEGFIERMEAAGFASLRRATREDWESAFAADRGIEKGGAVWALTPAGRAVLAAGKGVP
jgi:hypothetical protein